MARLTTSRRRPAAGISRHRYLVRSNSYYSDPGISANAAAPAAYLGKARRRHRRESDDTPRSSVESECSAGSEYPSAGLPYIWAGAAASMHHAIAYDRDGARKPTRWIT